MEQKNQATYVRKGMRGIAQHALSRAAGAPLLTGNRVELLRDAKQNYPAWIKAIETAQHTIHFESYIIHEDEQGRKFAEALKAKARAGVKVRLIYDWLGGLTATSNAFWRDLREAGVEVRCFNPPRFDSPLGWLGRDHRKTITADGRIGFVTGLCVGQMWVGDPTKGIEPWRDTGVLVEGPAVADLVQAFGDVWATMGEPLPAEEIPARESLAPAGDIALRVVGSLPNTAGMYRLDQLISASAKRTLWLTDAYYAGTTPYVQALRAAALDGVDVRLLVPQATDIPIMRALSRAGFRTLLESGVRVFEWNGPMLHAKTAVADGMWARVGSTNLNLASWVGNYELDIVVEDANFGEEMEAMYEQDLQNATEVLLTPKRRLQRTQPARKQSVSEKIGAGSSGKAAAGVIRLSNAVGAAMTGHRLLGPAEAKVLLMGSALLGILSVLMVLWPRVVMVPLALFMIWMAIALLIRGVRLYHETKINPYKKGDTGALANNTSSLDASSQTIVQPQDKP